MTDLEQQLIDAGARWRETERPVVVDWERVTHERVPRRRRLLVTVAAVLCSVAIATAAVVAMTDDQRPSVRVQADDSEALPGPGTIDVAPAISQIGSLAVSDGSLWVSGYAPDLGPASVEEIDLRTGQTIGTATIPENAPYTMALAEDAVWVRAQQDETSTALHKIDRATREIEGTVELRKSGGLVVTDDAVWVGDGVDLLRIDPETLETVATIELPGVAGYNPGPVAAGPFGVWLASPYDGTVWWVGEGSNTVELVADVGDYAGRVVKLGDSLWVVAQPENTEVVMGALVEISASTGAIGRQIDVATRILDLASDGRSLWLAADGPVLRIDPDTGSVIPVRGAANSSVVAAAPDTGEVWAGQLAQLTQVAPAGTSSPAKLGWRELPPSPLAAREEFAVAATGTAVYLVGGRDAETDEELSDAAVFDVGANEWRLLPEVPLEGEIVAAAADEQRLVVVAQPGGLTAPVAVATYDVAMDAWRSLGSPGNDVPSLLGVALRGDELLLATGALSADRRNETLILDVTTARWSSGPDAPVAVNDGALTWTGEELLLVGTFRTSTELGPVVAAEFQPTSREWRPLEPPALGRGSVGATSSADMVYSWSASLLATNDAALSAWSASSEIPLPPQDCFERGAAFADGILLWRCDQRGAIFRPSSGAWTDLPSPPAEMLEAIAPSADGVVFWSINDLGQLQPWLLDAS